MTPDSKIDHRTACGGIASVYARFFNDNPVAAKLILGPDSNGSDVHTIARPKSSFSTLLGDLMAQRTGLASRQMDQAAFPDVFQVLVQLISSLFAVGLRREGRITENVKDEAGNIAATYLESKLADDDQAPA